MKKEELIERCKEVRKTAGETIPFHAPEVAPKLTEELLQIYFESIREFVYFDKEFREAYGKAKEMLESLVGYYSNYFGQFKMPKVEKGK